MQFTWPVTSQTLRADLRWQTLENRRQSSFFCRADRIVAARFVCQGAICLHSRRVNILDLFERVFLVLPFSFFFFLFKINLGTK